jgi:hypothetical protein
MKGVTTGVLVGVVRQTQPASLPAEMLFEDSLVVAAAALSAHAPNIETPLDNERLAPN